MRAGAAQISKVVPVISVPLSDLELQCRLVEGDARFEIGHMHHEMSELHRYRHGGYAVLAKTEIVSHFPQ
jgi:hypothetical protein